MRLDSTRPSDRVRHLINKQRFSADVAPTQYDRKMSRIVLKQRISRLEYHYWNPSLFCTVSPLFIHL